MDTVTIDGVEYVKASVLARQHRYTADYIGQLCRANKVDAHLVGRTWYVYPPSLDTHKSTRYSELRFADKNQNNTQELISSRRSVIAPPAKNTSKARGSNFAHRVFWRGQEYQEDDGELLPSLAKQREGQSTTEMKVDLADSRRVAIVGRSERVTMVSEPPPAIALAGTLKVQAYEPRFADAEDEAYAVNDIEKASHIGYEVTPESASTPTVPRAKDGGVSSHRSPTQPEFPVYNVPLKKQSIEHAPLSFTPKTVRTARTASAGPLKVAQTAQTASPAEQVANDPTHSLFFNLVIAPAMVLLVIMVAGSFFFLESLTEVNARGEQVKIFNLSASTLESIFR